MIPLPPDEADERLATIPSDPPDDDDCAAPLEAQLVERVREWFRRSAPRAAQWRNRGEAIHITLSDAGEDDSSGELWLEARIEERSYTRHLEGRVPGERYR